MNCLARICIWRSLIFVGWILDFVWEHYPVWVIWPFISTGTGHTGFSDGNQVSDNLSCVHSIKTGLNNTKKNCFCLELLLPHLLPNYLARDTRLKSSFFEFLNIKPVLIHSRYFGPILLGLHQDSLDIGRIFVLLFCEMSSNEWNSRGDLGDHFDTEVKQWFLLSSVYVRLRGFVTLFSPNSVGFFKDFTVYWCYCQRAGK